MQEHEEEQHHGPNGSKMPRRTSRFRTARATVNQIRKQIGQDNISIVAAGVAFFLMLAIFPGLAAFVALYGLIADPADVAEMLSTYEGALPEEVFSILNDQLTGLAQSASSTLSLGLIVALGTALWSAGKGVRALMSALNIAYGTQEKRHVVKRYALSILLTACTVLFGIAALALLAAVPAILTAISPDNFAQIIISVSRWPILAFFVMGFLAVMYAIGPCRSHSHWRFGSPGAIAAALLWLVGSIGFSIYVANFGNFNRTYGSIAAVVVLLIWFYLSAYIVLLGAELNAHLENNHAEKGAEPQHLH